MITESTFHTLALILLSSVVTVSFYYRWQAHKAGAATGDRISARTEEKPLLLAFRSIFGLGLWLSSMVYLVSPGWIAWAQVPLPAGVRFAGAAAGAAALPLIVWVFSSLGKNVTHTTAVRSQHTLVTAGPYRYVRHPLYTVGMLWFLGFSLLAANVFIFACAVLGFAAILLRTPFEEQRLLERFGEDYRQYMQRTGRFLPRLG
jgi:protein-S-isoprenylcysteine O-methyltransferase Ste14